MEDQEEEEAGEEEIEVIKHAPPQPRYKQRQPSADVGILESFLTEGGLDKEDVQMFKLAYARLKGEEEDRVIEDLPWAHYPNYILE